jgi:hypothetical protein
MGKASGTSDPCERPKRVLLAIVVSSKGYGRSPGRADERRHGRESPPDYTNKGYGKRETATRSMVRIYFG